MLSSLASVWNAGSVPQGQLDEESDRCSLPRNWRYERRIAGGARPYYGSDDDENDAGCRGWNWSCCLFGSFCSPLRSGGYPTPRVFLGKSSDLLEKKRVEFLMSAKECGRVSNERS